MDKKSLINVQSYFFNIFYFLRLYIIFWIVMIAMVHRVITNMIEGSNQLSGLKIKTIQHFPSIKLQSREAEPFLSDDKISRRKK